MSIEISPPWIMYPGFPPADTFWRQSGEHWFYYIWRPFWESLLAEQQEEYLSCWSVPDEWRKFYFDREFTVWLKNIDET